MSKHRLSILVSFPDMKRRPLLLDLDGTRPGSMLVAFRRVFRLLHIIGSDVGDAVMTDKRHNEGVRRAVCRRSEHLRRVGLRNP